MSNLSPTSSTPPSNEEKLFSSSHQQEPKCPTPPISDKTGSTSPRQPQQQNPSSPPKSQHQQHQADKKKSSPRLPPKIIKKIIVDTDCGGDDALGILVAATDPTVEIVMLTAVWGNCDVHQGVENLGKLVDVIGKDIPIFVGAKGPMLGQERETSQWYGYGDDGFGDAGFDHSARADRAEKSGKHASLAILETLSGLSTTKKEKNNTAVAAAATTSLSLISGGGSFSKSGTEHIVDNELKEEEEEEEEDEEKHDAHEQEREVIEVWQLYCLGPLTNIAIALQLNPQLFAHLGSVEHEIPGVIIMGGALYGKGNANLSSEFNFASDPEAARTVFNNRSCPSPHLVITWELTVDLALPWEVFDRMLGRIMKHQHHHHKDVTHHHEQQQQQEVNVITRTASSFLATIDDNDNDDIEKPKNHSTATNLPHNPPSSILEDENNNISSSNFSSSLQRSNSAVRNPRLQSFLIKLLKKFEETSRPAEVETGDQERTQDSCVICDAVCVVIGLNAKECIAESTKTFATVELHGHDTRGTLCIDWYGNEQSRKKKGRWVNAEVVLKAKHNLINEIIAGITVLRA